MLCRKSLQAKPLQNGTKRIHVCALAAARLRSSGRAHFIAAQNANRVMRGLRWGSEQMRRGTMVLHLLAALAHVDGVPVAFTLRPL